MNRLILLFLVCRVLCGAEGITNLLSIHLVADPTFLQEESSNTPKLETLKLVSPPMLADEDFVKFDADEQTFTVTPDAAQRVAKEIWKFANQTPKIHRTGRYELVPFRTAFVLKVSGEPIYVGAFYSLVFSRTFEGPVIIPDVPFIHTNLTTNVSFTIQPGYPGGFKGIAEKMRDARIVAAAKKLSSRKNDSAR